MTEALPLLLDLDGQRVSERWASDEEEKASGDEDEEFPELSSPFCSEQGDPAFQGLQPPQSSLLPSGVWGGGPKSRSASGPEEDGQCSQGQVSVWACR